MKQTTSKNSSPTANEIIIGLTKLKWKADGNTGDPTAVPTLESLLAFDAAPLLLKHYGELVPNLAIKTAVHATSAEEEITPVLAASTTEYYQNLYSAIVNFGGADLLISEIANHIEKRYALWQAYKDRGKDTPPAGEAFKDIISLISAWSIEQTAKPITQEYDRTHPVAIIDKASMGSIRDVILTSELSEDIGEISSISAPAPTNEQIEIPGVITESPLPNVLPLQAIKMEFGGDTTKRGAVAMPIRLFFEALMALEPKETQASIKVKLGDLLRYLNPDAKYHRTTHLPYVIQGLHNLGWLRIPYRENPDKPSTEVDWIPVMPRTVPNINSGDDAPIILEVKLPPDATGGMMVEKDILRLTGKHSSAKFNAYLSACWIIDRNGTVPQGIIDPTKPVERRDDEGNLLTAEGTRIFDSRGKPITSLYKAASQLDREPNPARERYPILSFDNLTRACFPKGYNQKKKATYRQRALKAWEELETNGIIRIEKKRHGWRIMPSVAHVARYRAIDGTRG